MINGMILAAEAGLRGAAAATDWIWSAAAFVFVLGILVFVHELGHFIAAKAAGIRVDEFAFGFGPKWIRLFRKGDTEYTIHPIPLGGFVKLAGMEPGEEDTPDGFNTKPVLVRFAVILAGPMMNMVLALLFFITMGFTTGTPVPGVPIKKVHPGTEAARVGLRPGDIITHIDVNVVLFAAEAIQRIHGSAGRQITITVRRGDRESVLRVTPRPTTLAELYPDVKLPKSLRKEKIGIIGFETSSDLVLRRTGLAESVSNGFTYTYGATKMMLVTIFGRLGGAAIGQVPISEVKREVGGPIAIFFIVKVAVEQGIGMVVLLIALLSVNLGVVNLLPIPVLDGGHLALLALEGIRRKRLSPEKQAIVQWIGLTLILLLMVVLFYNDISRLSEFRGR